MQTRRRSCGRCRAHRDQRPSPICFISTPVLNIASTMTAISQCSTSDTRGKVRTRRFARAQASSAMRSPVDQRSSSSWDGLLGLRDDSRRRRRAAPPPAGRDRPRPPSRRRPCAASSRPSPRPGRPARRPGGHRSAVLLGAEADRPRTLLLPPGEIGDRGGGAIDLRDRRHQRPDTRRHAGGGGTHRGEPAPDLVGRGRRCGCASCLTSEATTAKPRPASPAWAASIVALSASRFVLPATSSMMSIDLVDAPHRVGQGGAVVGGGGHQRLRGLGHARGRLRLAGGIGQQERDLGDRAGDVVDMGGGAPGRLGRSDGMRVDEARQPGEFARGARHARGMAPPARWRSARSAAGRRRSRPAARS